MKLRYRFCSLFLAFLIVFTVTLSPFGKKVYAVEPISMGVISLVLSILSACGVTVNLLMSDIFPKSGGFDPGVLDNPLTTAEDRKAMMAELEKVNVPNSNFAKQALDAVAAKLKPFTDKVGELASRFSLSGMAAIIGMGVNELLDKAKTGTLELTKEQAIAMQKFMTENFSEVMAGNLSVMNGTMVAFSDMCSTYQSFPMSELPNESAIYKTNYYTNTRTKESYYILFDVSRKNDYNTLNALVEVHRAMPSNGVYKEFSESSSTLNHVSFPNGFSGVYIKNSLDNRGLLEINFYDTLINSSIESSFYFPYDPSIPLWQSADSVLVSTDAPTLAATGDLFIPTTDLPLTLPNTLTGGVSIPVAQDLAEVNTKALADAIARAGGIDVPGEIPPIPPVIPPDFPDFTMPGSIINKFPFSIPFDIVKGARLLVAPPVTPKFDVKFSIPVPGRSGIPIAFTIDLTPFDKLASMCRTFSILIFTVGLAVATPKIVKGAK